MSSIPHFESLDQMAEATAAKLAEAAAGCAYTLANDKQFQKLARYDTIGEEEQNRIFNELVVAGLVQTMMVLEAPDLRVEDEFRGYLTTLRDCIPKAHVEFLRSAGVEDEHLATWHKLIDLRYNEYVRDRHSVRAAAMEIESAESDLDLHDLANIHLVLPVQTVAIGCHRHVCRGETDGRDDLFKMILKSLSKFYLEFRVPLELGRKITPFMRFRVALKKLVRRIFFPPRK